MENKSIVTLWRQTSSGHSCGMTMLYALGTKQALINAYQQLLNNFNTWEYPKDMDCIIKSKVIKDRYYIEMPNGNILQSDRAQSVFVSIAEILGICINIPISEAENRLIAKRLEY